MLGAYWYPWSYAYPAYAYSYPYPYPYSYEVPAPQVTAPPSQSGQVCGSWVWDPNQAQYHWVPCAGAAPSQPQVYYPPAQ